jgi:hypothetical protein
MQRHCYPAFSKALLKMIRPDIPRVDNVLLPSFQLDRVQLAVTNKR